MSTLSDYRLTPRIELLFAAVAIEGAVLGRVIRQDRGHVIVMTEAGQLLVKVRAQRTGVVVTGDWVSIEGDVVMHVLERRSMLRRGVASRSDPENVSEQPLVANVDFVLAVTGADRPRTASGIERVVAQTQDAGAAPVIIITKADLLDDIEAELSNIRNIVPNIDVFAVSSRLGNGLDALREAIRDVDSVMIGESGAGKSTLLNALLGEEVSDTGVVRDADSRGRHTTVRRELHLVPGGGVLIDTPGLRAVGLWAEAESVDATFSDVADVAENCRFADCAHETEPGCAIREALDEGSLSQSRFESWQELRREAEVSALRKDEHEKRKAEKKFGRAVSDALEMKGRSRRRR